MLRSCLVGSALAFVTSSVVSAQVNRRFAYDFGVLAGSSVGSRGVSFIDGSVGVFSGAEIIGFPPE